jgi:hypothetical protein
MAFRFPLLEAEQRGRFDDMLRTCIVDGAAAST